MDRSEYFMKIIVQGLGKMGYQIVQKLCEDNHQVIAINRSLEPLQKAQELGANITQDKKEAIELFGHQEPVILWIMLPAEIVDEQINQWDQFLPKKSLIIDGGNSDYRQTIKRAQMVESLGHSLVDIGTSGGIHGYKNGFSMMIGANQRANFELIEPVVKSLAKPEGDYKYFGQNGTGHFVKMTHNAIEYGMMESLAEGYNLLKNGPFKEMNLKDAAEVWQHHSVITSWLNSLCLEVFNDNPELDGIDGFVHESGEAKWALETAHKINVPMPVIQKSFDIRIESQHGQINFATKLLAAMRNKFGGHDLNK